jgi:endonuclease I
MKKIIYSMLLAVAFNLSGIAQAVLPTSWSFTTTTLPTGWSESSTVFYTASGNTPPSKKFSVTGETLTIFFASNPGNLTYYLAGNSFSGGTFLVEESVDGTAWTTLHTHTAPPAATYTLFTDVPNSLTRYIRFNYSNKVTGNIGLDDVSIALGAATPAQEINVKQNTTTILTGGNYVTGSPVGTMSPITFTVENLGTTNPLNVSGVTITGANAADYSVASAPTTIAGLASDNLVINFTPSAAGNRNAVLNIANNDADENPYIINLQGIGGTYATEPTAQPTNLVFSNVKTYRVTGTFTAASPAPEGYLVLRKKGSAITGVPADGTVYKRGDIVGDAQVVYSGTPTAFSPNNIVASTDYYFAVYAYNGPSTFRNYLTANPLTGNVTTPATMQPAAYYSGINTASATFLTDLHNLINPHTQQFYSNYSVKLISLFAARDTTDDRRVLTCVYSGENKVYTEPFDFTTQGYSREHTYCHNWMPTNPAQALPEYNDYHHLFPTNQNNANGVRSNYPLGKVVTVSSSYLGAKFGLDANGHMVYEPRDEHKGDAARAMMYESVCYNSVSGNVWKFPTYISGSIPYGQDQYILKQWNFQDLPSSWEISRNDFIDSLQDNRNPFVDNPEYACYVNFENMTYETNGCFASIEEKLAASFIVYPNPAKKVLFLNVDGTTISSYELIDMQGRTVKSSDVSNLAVISIPTDALKAGSYIVKVKTPFGEAQKSLIIE